MPYTRITGSHNGREAIDYALGAEDNKGHNGNEVRNEFITTVGMTPNQPPSYADQMDMYWKQASRKNKNQVRRIITSFSKDELDPDDPKSVLIAGEIGRQHALKYYPDRQTLICVQKDGVGGCIHIHELVSNVSMTDLKGCTDEQTKFSYVARTMDELAKEYIVLSMDYKDKWDENTGKAILPKDKTNQNVRRMRDENREAEAKGEEPVHYIWEDDLKERIRQAMQESTSRDDFAKRLTAHGVEIGRTGKSKKNGEYFTYELVDTTGFEEPPKKEPKARSYNLGEDYTPEALDAMITENLKRTTPYKPVQKPEPKVETKPVQVTKSETAKPQKETAQKAPENDFKTSQDINIPVEHKTPKIEEYELTAPNKPKLNTTKSKTEVEVLSPKEQRMRMEQKRRELEEQRRAERRRKILRDAELLNSKYSSDEDQDDYSL